MAGRGPEPAGLPGQWAVRGVAGLPLLALQPAVRRPVVLEARAWQAAVRLPAEWLAGAYRVAGWPAGRWDVVVDRVSDCVAGVRG